MVHNYSLRVRYGDTYQMRRVHHAAFLHYLETARIEMLRDLGWPYAEIEAHGFFLPVIAGITAVYKGNKFALFYTIGWLSMFILVYMSVKQTIPISVVASSFDISENQTDPRSICLLDIQGLTA